MRLNAAPLQPTGSLVLRLLKENSFKLPYFFARTPIRGPRAARSEATPPKAHENFPNTFGRLGIEHRYQAPGNAVAKLCSLPSPMHATTKSCAGMCPLTGTRETFFTLETKVNSSTQNQTFRSTFNPEGWRAQNLATNMPDATLVFTPEPWRELP